VVAEHGVEGLVRAEEPNFVRIGAPRIVPVEGDRDERLGPGRLEVKRRLASNPLDSAMVGAPGSNSATPSVHPDPQKTLHLIDDCRR
jgi:hypothetical protein